MYHRDRQETRLRATSIPSEDGLIAEILLEQAQQHEGRRELCERWLDRAETRARFLHDEITTTGERLLRQLSGAEPGEAVHAAE